jgi:hypothetical protein
MRVRVRRARARRAAPCKQSHLESHEWRLIDAGGGGLCGCKHATHGAWIYHLSMQHACTSAKGPRTTSGAVRAIKSHKLMAFQATPLGPVWVHAHYPTTMRMSSVDAACVFECEGPTHSSERRRAIKLIARMAPQRRRWGLCGCTHAAQRPCICRLSMQHACTSAAGGPTHDERRRAIKSQEWCLSDAARACVVACTLSEDQVHAVCRCSMRVRVRRAHARLAAPCKQLARMTPQRRRWGLCGCTHATHGPWIYHLSMQRSVDGELGVHAAQPPRPLWARRESGHR